MLELYHSTTSVCAIKVRIVLAEKGVDWDGHLLNLQAGDQQLPDYLKLNPKGVVPTLVHDGQVMVESSVIMTYLDEIFSDPPLQPADALSRARMRLWIKRVDDELHAGCSIITFATANRKALLKKSPEAREQYFGRIPNPALRETKRQSVEMGLKAPQVAQNIRVYDQALGAMEQTLAGQPWLAGATYSLADAALTPYLNRLEMLGMAGLWQPARPRVGEWLDRVRARATFAPAVTAYVTPADVERFTVPQAEVRQTMDEALAAS
ncbi:MAG: glutathione S-transferase family protein [bacterium]